MTDSSLRRTNKAGLDELQTTRILSEIQIGAGDSSSGDLFRLFLQAVGSSRVWAIPFGA